MPFVRNATNRLARATSGWKPMYSFASEDTTCPACSGKHRPRTFKEGCKKAPPEEASEPAPAKTPSKENVKKTISPDTKL